MIFRPTALAGAYVIELERKEDIRGFFARTVCAEEFSRHGLVAEFVQQSVSFNHRRGIVRGLHYQVPPHGETKLVRCTRGAIFDVIVDLRPESPTFRRWCGVELSADNHCQIYIPIGMAHGFQTLSEQSEVLYEMTTPFHAESSRGLRWDDPAFGIAWPDRENAFLSERDLQLPFLD